MSSNWKIISQFLSYLNFLRLCCIGLLTTQKFRQHLSYFLQKKKEKKIELKEFVIIIKTADETVSVTNDFAWTNFIWKFCGSSVVNRRKSIRWYFKTFHYKHSICCSDLQILLCFDIQINYLEQLFFFGSIFLFFF